jgi:hypothetical protein
MHWGSAGRATRDPDLTNRQAPPRGRGDRMSPRGSRVPGAPARGVRDLS